MSDRDDDFYSLFGDDDDDPFGADDDLGGLDDDFGDLGDDFGDLGDDFKFDDDLGDFEGETDLFAADDDFGDDFTFGDEDADVTFDDDFAETSEGPSRTFVLVAVVMIIILLAAFGLIVAIVLGGRGPNDRELTATSIVQTNIAVQSALDLTSTRNALDMEATQTADAFTDTPSPSPTASDTPTATPDTSLTQTAVFRETLDAANAEATSVAADATATFFAILTTEPDIVPGEGIDELAQTATAIAGNVAAPTDDPDAASTTVAQQPTQETADNSAEIAALQATQSALEAQIDALIAQIDALETEREPIREELSNSFVPLVEAIESTQTAVEASGADDTDAQLAELAATLEALRDGSLIAPQLTEIAATLEALQGQTGAEVEAQQTALPATQTVLTGAEQVAAQLTPIAATQSALEQQNNELALQLTAVVQSQTELGGVAVAQVDPIQMTETAVAGLGQGGGFATPTQETVDGGLPTARPTVSGNAVALTATALAEILNPPAVTQVPGGGDGGGVVVPTVAIGVQPPDDQLPDTGLFDDIFAGNPAIIFGAALSLLAVIGLSRVLRSQNRKRD